MPTKYKVHTFRGLLGDGGEDEISLERSNVNLAYRVVKFEVIGNAPGAQTQESVIKIYRESQSSVNGVIDFDDVDLVGAGIWFYNANSAYPLGIGMVFDNTLFSRNLYVTHKDVSQTYSCNYYIEIEEVPVSASTLMQLKLGVARKLDLSQSPPED